MDFGLYVVAIICFIIAALPYTNVVSVDLLKLEYPMNLTLTVVFAALGLVLIILGYSQRPKPIISIPEAPKQGFSPTSPPAQSSPEETPEAPVSVPTPPASPKEETVKPESEKPATKTRRKRTRKRRKKT